METQSTENRIATCFDMVEMEYRGGAVESDLPMIPFEEKYYKQYQKLINDCFYEMRKELNIRPYAWYHDNFDELMRQKENIFLHADNGELICVVSCYGNEIGTVAVNVKVQRQGYGRKVMKFALEYLQKRGVSPIILTVTKWNQNAIALYQSLGFEITKETTVEGISTQDADGNWTFAFSSTGGLNLR